MPAQDRAMGNHDHTYKLLFAHPRMVRELLEGFVGGSWLPQLDFASLERVNGTYMSDDLRARADDIVWKVRCGEQHVYLLIEFQSSVEPFMAVRVLTYVGLLYQDLIRTRKSECEGGLPAVLPIVLHNGSSRWRAAEEIATLLQDVPDELRKHTPQLRYLLIDEGSFDDGELARDRNLVAMLFRLENCRQHDRLEELVSTLMDWLRNTEQDGLRRAFAVWLDRVILARLPGGPASTLDNLWEKQTMLSENFDRWEEEFRQEGRQEGRKEGLQQGEAAILTRLLQKRFGELPNEVRACLLNARLDQLEHWGERLLDVTSLNELFGADAVSAPGQSS
jgi:hypothetical protein